MKLKAKIDAQFYNGEMEVLDFVIPGKEAQQEIVAVAHLCHPKPSAVDNASGCGTLIEVARTLQNLITEKKLTQPQRGIRFLLVAEYTGSFCYLASNEDKINKMVAGINLDMIGADQSMGGGRTLLLEHTPNSNPSFVNDVLSAIFTEVCTKNENIETNGQIVSLKYNEQAFTGGSDHAVFNDIDVQVGMPMLMQWPDRYYHTSEDTIEKVSAEMLHIVGAITATYCYFLANANFTDILWIASEVVSKGKERIGMCGRKMFDEHINLLEEIKATKNTRKGYQEFFFKMKEKIETKINFQKDVEIKVLSSIQKLLQMGNEKVTLIELLDEYQKDLERYTESEIARVKVSIEKIAFSMNIPLSQKKVEKLIIKEKIIPKKVFKGNLTNLSFLDMPLDDVIELESINKECKDAYVIFENALNWIDGIKSLEEISHLVELDVGKTNLPFLTKIFEFHQKQGALKLIKKKEKE